MLRLSTLPVHLLWISEIIGGFCYYPCVDSLSAAVTERRAKVLSLHLALQPSNNGVLYYPLEYCRSLKQCNFLLMLRRSVEWTKGVDCLNVAAKELRNNHHIKSWLQIVLKQINSSRRCWSSDEGAVVRFLCIGKYKLWEKLWRSLYKSTVNNSLPLSITKIELHSVNFQRIRNDLSITSTSETMMGRVVGWRVIFRIVRAAYIPQRWSQYAYAKGTRHNGWNQTFMVVNKRGTAMKDEIRKLCV